MRALLPLLACAVLALAPARAQEAGAMLLEVRLGGQVLADGVTAYQAGRQVFLPLGELARLLTLAIRCSPDEGRASGYVLKEARNFSLDLVRQRLTVDGHNVQLEPSQVRREADDLYVASAALALWLPVDLEIDLPTLSLTVHPREQLPLQARLARGAQAATGIAGPAPFPLRANAYRWLDMPAIDQTVSVDLARASHAGNYTAYLSTDLAGLEAAIYLNSGGRDQQRAARLTLGRHDPDAGLLGPLHARSVEFGSLALAGVEHITLASPDGAGLALSNRPLDQPAGYDRHSLQGELPPGWDVELYFNDALVGFQAARADGKYSFLDLPLRYGPNEFRLVFHGPLGQLRVERSSFLLDQSSIAPGALVYSLAAQHGDDGRRRALARFEVGLSKRLSANATLTRVQHDGVDQRYRSAGLRAYWQSFIASAEFARDERQGRLTQATLKTGLAGFALSASHTRLLGFSSELYPSAPDALRQRDELRVDAAALALQLRRELTASGQQLLDAQARLSLYRQGGALSNTVRWQSLAGRHNADGVLQLSRRLAGIGLSAQIQYALRPHARLTHLALAADRNFANGYQLSVGVTRALPAGPLKTSAALTKRLGSFGLGLSAFSSGHDAGLGVQLFVGLGREPRRAQWLADAQPMANTGSASVRVFLDKNQNGLMDEGDEPVKGAGFTVNGARQPARTDADGIAWLRRLPPWQHVDLGLDSETLDDPQWQPQLPGVRLVPRPGKVGMLDFALSVSGEIDGTAYLQKDGVKRGIGDLQLELRDGAGILAASVKSASDGYFVIAAVLPGLYQLRIAPAQLARLKLVDPGPQAIRMAPDGAFINGREFVVRAAP